MYETSLSSSPAHGRSNEEYMRTIQINPFAIQNIPNPSTEMKLAALRQNGLVLEFIENPTREMQVLALHNTAKAIQFIPDPPKEFLQQAIEQSWTNLAYVPNPPEWLIWKALEQSGWAIQYIENPSEDMQLQAVRKIMMPSAIFRIPHQRYRLKPRPLITHHYAMSNTLPLKRNALPSKTTIKLSVFLPMHQRNISCTFCH